jgi:hypothetical protein
MERPLCNRNFISRRRSKIGGMFKLQENRQLIIGKRIRGKYMQKAYPNMNSAVMLALLGDITPSIAQNIAETAQKQSRSICEVANFNSPSQVIYLPLNQFLTVINIDCFEWRT